MPMKKPAPCSTGISGKSAEERDSLLDLPEFSEESCRLMEGPPPTFEQQLAHAAMLRRWRREQGLPDDHPPSNADRFRF